tara:strand:+ start:644 stop:1102 length:459 start_codon:yes stop_codon:yes gene_type:complete
MAIIIENPNTRKSQKSLTDKNRKLIGIKLPLENSNNSEGYFESTDLSLDAVKENIKNLLSTRKGERVFYPTLGSGLDDFLFEPITEETFSLIQDNIVTIISEWLPFVEIIDVEINVEDDSSTDFTKNKINILVVFGLNNVPNVTDSVKIEIQ